MDGYEDEDYESALESDLEDIENVPPVKTPTPAPMGGLSFSFNLGRQILN